MGMRRGGARRLELLGWALLLLAFSPLVAQLAAALVQRPEQRPALLGWVLLPLALYLGPHQRAEPRAAGLALAALGALVQMLGIAGGAWSLARLGLPLAVCGLALHFGRPPLCTALLSVWTLPLPATALALLGPLSMHRPLTGLWAGLLAALGAPLEAAGPAVQGPGGILHVTARPGWVLAFALAGVGWYAAARSGATLGAAALRAALWALWALPLQALAILVALVVFSLAGTRPALTWLDESSWLVAALGGLAWVEWRARAAARSRPSTA